MVNIQYDQVVDEIDHFHNFRSFGSMEACHRIFSFKLNGVFPPVVALRVHLPGENLVYFDGRAGEPNRNAFHITELTEFFHYNRQNPGVQVPYVEFPKHFVWISKERKWKRRTKFVGTIGRVYNVHPKEGESFFLRMLLISKLSAARFNCYKNTLKAVLFIVLISRKTSSEDLRTVDGCLCSTFKEACEKTGLLSVEGEWVQVSENASGSSEALRSLFVYMLEFCSLPHPQKLLEQFALEWAHDFEVQFLNEPEVTLKSLVKQSILQKLEDLEIDHSAVGLHALTLSEQNTLSSLLGDSSMSLLPILSNELSFNSEELLEIVRSRTSSGGNTQSLNQTQLQIFSLINASVSRRIGGLFFIQARGGTGKTFLLNTLLAAARTVDALENTPALAVASSGIASTLLDGGRTAHSRFKIPINVNKQLHYRFQCRAI